MTKLFPYRSIPAMFTPKWRDKNTCRNVVAKIFDHIATGLRGILTLLQDNRVGIHRKKEQAEELIDELLNDIDLMIGGKLLMFGPNYKDAQQKQIQEIERIVEELTKTKGVISGLHGTSDAALKAGLNGALGSLNGLASSSVRYANRGTAFLVDASLGDKARSLFMISFPIILTVSINAIVGISAYWYKGLAAAEEQTRVETSRRSALLYEFKERRRSCQQLAENIALNHSANEYQMLRAEISTIVDGKASGRSGLEQTNWKGLVAGLVDLGATNGVDAVNSSLDELKVFFMLRDSNVGQGSAFPTNQSFRILSEIDKFLSANPASANSN